VVPLDPTRTSGRAGGRVVAAHGG